MTPSEFPPRKTGPPVVTEVGVVNAFLELLLEVLAALLFSEPAGNQDHRLGAIVIDDLIDHRRDRIGADGHDQEVDLVLEIGEGRHAGDAVDLAGGRVDHRDLVAVEACIHEIAEDDPAHVPAAVRNADDGDGLGFEEVPDLVDRALLVPRGGRSERADAVEGRHAAAGTRKGIDLHFLDVEFGIRVHG